ncbi:MAG TPA: hypothetical protein VL020_04650 [Pseudomonadales bacterium]|nr:hypothetical protein [Pseudomonadales bacterium]
MSKQAININTSQYLGETRVIVDGQDWEIKLPGAGTELRLSQAQRRIKLLDKKIENDTAVEADYDLYDKLENQSISIFTNMFKDGSEDNAAVKEWVESTPLAVIMASFEEIKEQAQNGGLEEDKAVDGQAVETPTA